MISFCRPASQKRSICAALKVISFAGPATLMLALTGCKTIETRTVDTSCTSFRPISYAQLPPGQVDDPGNVADSDATVGELDSHNAKWDALCPAKN